MDDHMSPLELFQLLRKFVHDPVTEEIVKALKKAAHFKVHIEDGLGALQWIQENTHFYPCIFVTPKVSINQK